MAVSDYAQIGFDINAKPTIAELKVRNACVQHYKTWIYVKNSDMWHKDYNYMDDTIAQIQDGEVYLSGFSIKAKRSETQDAIFSLVTAITYDDPKDLKTRKLHLMSGIGCYGYDNKIPSLYKHFQIDPQVFPIAASGLTNYNQNVSKECQPKDGWITFTIIHNDQLMDFYIERTPENKNKFESEWVGVSWELFQEFIVWLGTVIDDYDEQTKWYNKMKKLKKANIKFYNQGDKFFLDNGVIDKDIMQGIEDQKKPVIMDVIEMISKESYIS